MGVVHRTADDCRECGCKSTPVWQDYVAGTAPTNALSKFTAKIEMKDVTVEMP